MLKPKVNISGVYLPAPFVSLTILKYLYIMQRSSLPKMLVILLQTFYAVNYGNPINKTFLQP